LQAEDADVEAKRKVTIIGAAMVSALLSATTIIVRPAFGDPEDKQKL
jgi:hypothetical protein